MNPYKDGPAQSYDGIIVRVQKNAAAMQVLTVFTVQKGLIRLFAGTAKKTGKRSGSPFFLFAALHFELNGSSNGVKGGNKRWNSLRYQVNIVKPG